MKATSALLGIALFDKVHAHNLGLSGYEKLKDHEIKWVVPSGESNAVFKDFPLKEPFPELGVSTKSIITNISNTLLCASEKSTEGQQCSNFQPLMPGLLYCFQDDNSKSLYFGYSFFINVPPLRDEDLRTVIFEQATDAWKHVKGLSAKYPNYQQFHVGFRTGGSVAALIAHRLLTVPSLPFRLAENNSDNQIKVVTVAEIPIFSNRIGYNPIGLANYASFYFAESPKSAFLHYGTRISMKEYRAEAGLNLSFERLVSYLSLKEKAETRLKSATIERYRKIERALATELTIAANVANDLVEVFRNSALELYGIPQFHCAKQLQAELNEFLPHFKEDFIVCSVDSPVGDVIRPLEFTLKCHIHDEEKKKSKLIAQYDGRLVGLNNWTKACEELQPSMINDSWTRCLDALGKKSRYMGLISSLASKENNQCRYLTGTLTRSWVKKPSGCAIKAKSSDSILRGLYREDSKTFYSLIDIDGIPFPQECKDVLEPIKLGEEQVKRAENLLDHAFAYLGEMQEEKKPIDEDKSSHKHLYRLPNLFQMHSTPKYYTKGIQLSSNHFVADDETARKIIQCVGNRTAKLLDCSNPANRWIPEQCPDFCSHTKEGQTDPEICKITAYCANIKGFIGLFDEGLAYIRWSKMASLVETIKSTKMEQYSLFHFSPQSGIYSYIDARDHYFGVFFKELPKVQPIYTEELRRRHIDRNRDSKDYDPWDNI